MQVAALYDIHGNLPALRAVLEEVASINPTMLVVGGDVVSGPMPDGTLDALFGAGYFMRWVMGNADREVADAAGATVQTAQDRADAGDEGGAAAAWAAAHLRPEQAQLLETFQPTVATGGALFCHGSPRSDTEVLTPLTPDTRVEAACSAVRQRTVICGHTHRQFDREVGGRRIVNAGSVGLPYEGDAAAYWLLMVDGDPQLRRTPYDVGEAVDEIRATGIPGFEPSLEASLVEPADPDEISAFFEPAAG